MMLKCVYILILVDTFQIDFHLDNLAKIPPQVLFNLMTILVMTFSSRRVETM